MRAFGTVAHSRSALVRLAVGVLAATALAFLIGAGAAPASRIETSPSHIQEYVGSDWVGRVSVFFAEIDNPRQPANFTLSEFRFANLCSRRGSRLNATIRIGKDKRFDYHGHGFTVVGHVIGGISNPREIAGLASVSAHGCHSGPWWFGVKPPPPSG
jgi:hypothetical protein